MKYEQDPLREAACRDLPPFVADKFFQANGLTERFELMTAKAICGKCAVRAACLLDAITTESPQGVRGGESDGSVKQLRHQYLNGADSVELVTRAISRQKPMGGARTSELYGHRLRPRVRTSVASRTVRLNREVGIR